MTLNDITKTGDTSKNFIKDFEKVIKTGITLTNNEIKDIMKVIKPLENSGILLNQTTRKTTCQEGGFLNFLRSLTTAGLSLIKSILTP